MAEASAPLNDSRVDARGVRDRRAVKLAGLDELLSEARRLVQLDGAGKVRALGNLSLGQALGHLALWMHASIDGVPMDAPWWLKAGARLLRGTVLRTTLPPGYKLPPDAASKLIPPRDIAAAEGLAQLESAVARLSSTSQRAPSPMLGRLSPADWDRLHLRHAELHLSFMQVEAQ